MLGPFSFEPSVLVALAVSGLLLAIEVARGERPKLLEWADFVLFAVIATVGLLNLDWMNSWLSNHADEVSNASLTLLAFGSLLAGRPFTAPYTEARFPDMDEGLAARLDRVATVAWGVALGIAAVVGWYGEWVLKEPSNLWTAWVFQTVPLVVAFRSTIWFDRRTLCREAGEEPRPGRWALARDCCWWLIPTGIASLAFDGASTAFSTCLIATCIALTVGFHWLEISRGSHRAAVR